MSATLTLIAAVSVDGYISRGTGVPWDLPADRAHFRSYTRDKWLLLGRRTYEEMLGWFQPGHHPLVLTHDPKLLVPNGKAVASVPEALRLADRQRELICCGGAEIYQAAIVHAHRLIITEVHEFLAGGLPFPKISKHDWEPVSRRSQAMDDDHAVSFEIVTYQRIQRLDLAA
ncbi:MAG: dihydrofolate reductase [Verrucomicrobia bacterium]|nr:dihydrofolate reductase [Verrucomicrobiota bacterium]